MTRPTLTGESRVRLPALSMVQQGDDFLVGDPGAGVFLGVPEVGVLVIRRLADGATVAEAAQAAAEHAGQEVDVLDFATVLIDAGLVLAVDGRPVEAASGPERRGTRLEGVDPRFVRPFFSAPAWAVYCLAAVACVVLVAMRPPLLPSFEDFFFYPNPALCVVAVLALGIALAMGHEAAHWLAGRAAGVGVRLQVSRRLFIPVFEADLSQLWALPPRQRYGPFLAGMAFDVLVLSACLWLRAAWSAELVEAPALLIRLAGTVALLQLLSLAFQALVFLRTDLYAVLVTRLGCFNLKRVTALSIRRRLGLLRPRQAEELSSAHPRDVRAARWFGLLTMAGLVPVAAFFALIFVPGTVMMAGWVFGSVAGAPIASTAFLQALAVGGVAAVRGLAPAAIFAWQRVRTHPGVAA